MINATKLKKHLLRPIPLFLVQPVLSRCVEQIARNNPRIFARLGIHSGKRFLIHPTDMPFVLLLCPTPQHPTLRIRRDGSTAWDARISGSFLNLMKLVEARMDGDALFFSRELVVEGDTEAVVTLRNALDDIDSNIIEEAAKALGRPGIIGLRIAKKLERLHHEFAKNPA